MSMVRWEPLRELSGMREAMDRFFDIGWPRHYHLWRLGGQPDGGLTPSLDMYHTPEAVVVKASLPGVKPEDVDISVIGDTLTIKGEMRTEGEVKEEDYYCQERRYGAFSRTVGLPSGLKTDKAEAVFEHGILTLTIPKAEEVKAKTIKVQAKGVLEGKK